MEQRSKFTIGIIFSLLLHALLIVVAITIAKFQPPKQATPNTVFVDLPTTPSAKFPNFAQAEKEKAKQIAESEKADNKTPSKDAKYLGERSQTVAQETKAKRVDTFRKGSTANETKAGKGLSFKDLAEPSNTRIFSPPTKLEAEGYRKEQERIAKNEAGGDGRPLNEAQDSSSTNDYLKDVKEGDRTLLNTKEFIYFGYYQRIKRSLEVAWTSKLRNTLDSYGIGGRQLANNNNYVTGLIVVLDRAGRVTGVQVLQRSGAKDLDQAAIDAFNQAGPFPDPPSSLVDEKGEIHIRWDFILQS